VWLGRGAIECTRCGEASPIDPALEARLRHNASVVEATLECVAIERRKAALTRATGRTMPLLVAGVLTLVSSCWGAGFGGMPLMAAMIVVALGLLVAFGALSSRLAKKLEKPTADVVVRVLCSTCGAAVPTVGAAIETMCPFCSTPLALSSEAGAQATREANRLERAAEQDIEDAHRDYKEATKWLSQGRDKPK